MSEVHVVGLIGPTVAVAYNIRGFKTKEMDGVYRLDGDLTVGGKPTYWSPDCKFFMYFQVAKGTWQISPRRDAASSLDLLEDARRGGSKGFAMQIRDTVWREFVDGTWQLTELQVCADQSAAMDGGEQDPVSARPFPCPGGGGGGGNGVPFLQVLDPAVARDPEEPDAPVRSPKGAPTLAPRGEPAALSDSLTPSPDRLPQVSAARERGPAVDGSPARPAAAGDAPEASAPGTKAPEAAEPVEALAEAAQRAGAPAPEPEAAPAPAPAPALPDARARLAEEEAVSDEDADGAPPPVLESIDLRGVARYFAERRVSRVVVLCGAGISTSAGIPDFRSPGSGLYHNLQRLNLPRAEAIFELEFFRKHPGPFYELCRDLWPGRYSPTPAHYFVRLLHEKGVLLRCYSQNIDSLELRAGLPKERLVAVHGNFEEAHVVDSRPEVLVEPGELKAALDGGNQALRALRQRYGGLVKPKIVFFGEEVSQRFTELSEQDLRSCDMMLVIGTSLSVEPLASLVGKAPPHVPRLLINYERVGHHKDLEGGFCFDQPSPGRPQRDVWFCGDCDLGVCKLAEQLDWSADLEALTDSEGKAAVPRAPWAPPPTEQPEALGDRPPSEAQGGGAVAEEGQAAERSDGAGGDEEPPAKRQRTE